MSRWVAAWIALAGIAGCSSSGGSPGPSCNVRYDCGPSQTCSSQGGQSYVCTGAGSLAAGSSCNPSSAMIECAPQLGCLGSPPAGTCTPWCNADGSCPGNTGTCTSVTDAQGVTVKYCI